MATFRPLSRRDDPTYDEPFEGLPAHLLSPVLSWISDVVHDGGQYPNGRLLEVIQLRLLRDYSPLDWSSARSAHDTLVELVNRNRELGLDVVDLLLRTDYGDGRRDNLALTLSSGGSAWEPGGGYREGLVRRAPAPVREAMAEIRTDSQRGHDHLHASWRALMGRDPNPSTAYWEAVRAVEAAAKPVLSRDNPKATLGSMIAALRDKPEKWRVGLEHAEPTQVLGMCQLLWRGQIDRHGSDDPDAPPNVSQEEADSAFYLALTLVRLFTSGAIALR